MSDVAIIGAGIGGLAAAIGLASTGHDISIFEQAEAIDEIGAGLQLSPNAVHALRAIGADEAVLARASVSHYMRIFSGNTHLNTLNLQALGRHYRAPFLVMHRADLQGALLEVAQGLPNIEIHLGHRLESIEGNTLTFKNGISHMAQAIIGADGVHSRLRELVFDVRNIPNGLVAWRGMAPLESGDTHVDLYLMPHAHAVTYPLPHVGMRNVVVIGSKTSPLPLRERVSAKLTSEGCVDSPSSASIGAPSPIQGEGVSSLTSTISNWTHWPLSIAPIMPTWTRGNITILGDAAHAMTPFAAQGTCMALEDAAVLMQVCKGQDFPQAFQAYEQARKQRCEQVQALSLRNGKIYHYSGLMGRMRDFTLHAGAGSLLKQRMDWVWGWNGTPHPRA